MVYCVFICVSGIAASAQESDNTVRRFSIDERFDGSSSSFAQILKLNTNFGYQLGEHVGIDLGAPLYFVRTSASDPTTTTGSKGGIGNAYFALRLSFNGALNYTSSVTGTAPTGDRNKGLSTGHATVDWNNFVEKVIAHRVAPYTNFGIASTVSDTNFFIRPFSSSGLVGHGEAGMTLSISRRVYIGGSEYAIVPSGKQTVVSKVVEVQTVPQPARRTLSKSHGHGAGRPKPQPDAILETTREVIGTADLVSDHGSSAWIGIGPLGGLNFTLGYSRSNRYALSSVFWGVTRRFGPFSSRLR